MAGKKTHEISSGVKSSPTNYILHPITFAASLTSDSKLPKTSRPVHVKWYCVPASTETSTTAVLASNVTKASLEQHWLSLFQNIIKSLYIGIRSY